jgi:pyruvate dehydrogenase E1 component alpha subunit
MSDPATYRSRAEVDVWKERDPLPRLKAIIQNDFEIGDEEFAEVDGRVKEELEQAVAFAEAGSELRPERLYEDVYVEAE